MLVDRGRQSTDSAAKSQVSTAMILHEVAIVPSSMNVLLEVKNNQGQLLRASSGVLLLEFVPLKSLK